MLLYGVSKMHFYCCKFYKMHAFRTFGPQDLKLSRQSGGIVLVTPESPALEKVTTLFLFVKIRVVFKNRTAEALLPLSSRSHKSDKQLAQPPEICCAAVGA